MLVTGICKFQINSLAGIGSEVLNIIFYSQKALHRSEKPLKLANNDKLLNGRFVIYLNK